MYTTPVEKPPELAAASKGQLAETGYLYVPEGCSEGQTCKLHVSFHGCKQYGGAVGDVPDQRLVVGEDVGLERIGAGGERHERAERQGADGQGADRVEHLATFFFLSV